MKKVFAVLILAVMAFGCFGASAEEIDLSGMDTAELIALYQKVGSEISSRIGLSDANRIGQGDYLVGRDILPGYYDFVCLETDTYDDGDAYNEILISMDGERIYLARRTDIGQHATFHLEEGMNLEISGCSGTLTSISPAWAPRKSN